MLQLLELIGSFFENLYVGVSTLISTVLDMSFLFSSAFLFSPAFLYPILVGMLAMAIIMWVVNIL